MLVTHENYGTVTPQMKGENEQDVGYGDVTSPHSQAPDSDN